MLITRERAEPLRSMLADQGHDCDHVPLIALRATAFPPPAGAPDAALITSASVSRFVPHLKKILGSAKVVAVGESTATSLSTIGVSVHRVGHGGGLAALELLDELAPTQGWYVGAEEPSEGLGEALKQRSLISWAVYRNEVPGGIEMALRRSNFDAITFTSGSAVHAFVDAVGLPQVPVIVIGQSTRKVAESLGVQVTSSALEPNLASLVRAVCALEGSHG